VLVLSRKLNQAIMIGDDVRIVVVAVDRDTVKLGIEAPRTIPVHRSEVYEEIQRTNRAAAGEPAEKAPEAPERVRVADLGRGRRTPPKP
jgi:carbon storage regulator